MIRPPLVVPGLLIGLLLAPCCRAAGPTVTLRTLATLRADQRTTLLRAGDRVIAFQPDVEHGRVLTAVGGETTRTLTIGLGAAGVDEAGRPNFEVKAVAATPGGELLLYVAPLGRADVSGLWRWRPGNEPARRVISGRDVAEVSGFGTLLPLAEVQMAAAGGDVWVMLRTPDQSAYCRLDARRLDSSPRLARPFTAISDGEATMTVERQDVWTGRADGSLTLFRPSHGEAWRVDPTGTATSLDATAATLPSTPQEQRTMPTVAPLDLRGGTAAQVLRFYPDLPRLAEASAATRYPLLVFGGAKTDTVIDRDGIDIRPGFPKHALRLTAWCLDAAGNVVAYDAMSGEVFRLNPGAP